MLMSYSKKVDTMIVPLIGLIDHEDQLVWLDVSVSKTW